MVYDIPSPKYSKHGKSINMLWWMAWLWKNVRAKKRKVIDNDLGVLDFSTHIHIFKEEQHKQEQIFCILLVDVFYKILESNLN